MKGNCFFSSETVTKQSIIKKNKKKIREKVKESMKNIIMYIPTVCEIASIRKM